MNVFRKIQFYSSIPNNEYGYLQSSIPNNEYGYLQSSIPNHEYGYLQSSIPNHEYGVFIESIESLDFSDFLKIDIPNKKRYSIIKKNIVKQELEKCLIIIAYYLCRLFQCSRLFILRSQVELGRLPRAHGRRMKGLIRLCGNRK